jgi:hypothetical protein
MLVIAGLDPAIHAATKEIHLLASALGGSVWTTGSSPVVTEKKCCAMRRGRFFIADEPLMQAPSPPRKSQSRRFAPASL